MRLSTQRCFPFILCSALLLIGFSPAALSAGAKIKKHYADVSDGQIHYVEAGQGETVLLLHQAPLSSAEFLEVIPLLAKHFRVIAWDAPGHGMSYVPTQEYEVPDYLRVLGEFTTALGLERVHVVGNHSGSAFAREFAARHPEKVGKIVLSGSARQPPEPKTELTKAKEFLSQPYSRELKMTPDGEFLPPAWGRYVQLAAPGAPLEIVFKPFVIGLDARTKPYDLHLAIFRFEGWTDPSQVETPIMLLSGEADFFVNQERLDYTKGLYPDCEVHPLIEGAGSFMPLEKPEAYSTAIIEFLKK